MHNFCLLHQLRDQMLHLLELFPGVLLMALPAVLGRGHALHGVERLGEDQGVAVAAGQGDTLNGIGRGVQKFPGLGDTEGSQKSLGRHP